MLNLHITGSKWKKKSWRNTEVVNVLFLRAELDPEFSLFFQGWSQLHKYTASWVIEDAVNGDPYIVTWDKQREGWGGGGSTVIRGGRAGGGCR